MRSEALFTALAVAYGIFVSCVPNPTPATVDVRVIALEGDSAGGTTTGDSHNSDNQPTGDTASASGDVSPADTNSSGDTSPTDNNPGDSTICNRLPGNLSWARKLDWQPGTTFQTSDGNPSPDANSNLVWYYEHTNGGPLLSGDAWYGQTPTLLVWDNDWYGQLRGAWTTGNDNPPPIFSDEMLHILHDPFYTKIPRARWKNVFSQEALVALSGNYVIEWGGDVATGAPNVNVQVVVAHLKAASTEVVFSATVAKPTPDNSDENTLVDIPTGTEILIAPGESLVFSLRAVNSIVPPSWITLKDNVILQNVPCN